MDLGGMLHRLRGDGRLCYRTYYAYYISAYNRSRLTESDALELYYLSDGNKMKSIIVRERVIQL